MALKTPLHLQRRRLINDRHLRHVAVTGRAAYALLDVNAVIEIDVIRQIVNPHPLYWFSSPPAFSHGR